MNEMIPQSNSLPADKASLPKAEVVLDPNKYTEVTELAPSQPDIESLSQSLQLELNKAADYDEVMYVLAAAVAKNGHQTVETALLARYNDEPSGENKFYLDLVGDMAESVTIPSQESLSDPDFEGIESLLEVVNKYTKEEIDVVTSITTPAEAFASPERKRMKDDIAPVYKLACRLRWETKADSDTDHALYPEFWQIFEKFEAMHRAVGVINMIEKSVRHDLRVQL